MNEQPVLRDRIVAKYAEQEPGLDPELLGRIVDDVAASLGKPSAPRAVFDVSWMDSYVAHWALGQEVLPQADRLEELAPTLRDLMDARFAERLDELRQWVERLAAPPDGGTPEPGVPPVPPVGPDPGPVPPDGGPPEPGVPPVGPVLFEPPDGGPPEPGVPPVGPAVFEPPDAGPPEPGVPPVGPQASLPGENPWILYWFVSIKAPLLLDMLDAHLERRLEEIGVRR